MRREEGLMKVRNLRKKGWPSSIWKGKRNVWMNLLNQGKRGLQPNLSIKDTKFANELAEFREERLLNQCQYQNEKIANESAELKKQPDTTLLCCFCSYSSYLLQNIRSQYGSLHLFSLIIWYGLIDEVSSPFSDFFPFSSLNEAQSPSGFFFLFTRCRLDGENSLSLI